MDLEPPDTMYVAAAIGWLELGNAAEAKAELAHVSAPEHPDVLEAWWLIHAQNLDWEQGLKVAETLLQVAPERVSGWLHRAYAARRLPSGGSLERAWDCLFPAAARFPKEPTVAYNLACYACQLGKHDDARRWLRKAMRIDSKDHVRRMALEDPDLKPLWKELEQL